jgi:hypothetical protein
MDGPELTTIAKAAIENVVLLTINHSLGSAEPERSSAVVLFFCRKGVALAADSPSSIVAIRR